MSPSRVIAEAKARGAMLSVTPEGRLRVRSRGPLPQDLLSLFADHKAELVVYLTRTANEPWDRGVALHVMDQADAAVEQSGISGTHPEVQAAVRVVSTAYAAEDLAGVRAACRALSATVRRLASNRHKNVG